MKSLEPFVPRRDATALLVVDIQERLFAAMDPDRKESVLANTRLLLQLARTLSLPVLLAEQYPKGLGRTIPPVLEALPEGTEPFERVTFSSWKADGLARRFRETGARYALVAGLETHVCVLGTVIDMLAEGIAVHVPRDAVISRSRENYETGLELMGRAGAFVTSTETVIFQMLERAGTDEFKTMSKLLK